MLSQLYKKIRLLKHKGKEPYLSIYKMIGFYPDNIRYYKQAFLHKSSSMNVENEEGMDRNNERLEFLGDAVLSAIVADIVYEHFRGKSEGFLTNTRSKIVSRESMNWMAKELGIDHLLHYSINHPFNESHNSNMLGNALEALIGAIYLDQGFKACYKFINDVLIKKYIDIDKLSEKEVNFKSNLIEWAQKNKLEISFDVIESFMDEQGNPVFQTAVTLAGTAEKIGIGIGYSKKESQQHAAQMAMKKIRTDRAFQQYIISVKKKRRQEAKEAKAVAEAAQTTLETESVKVQEEIVNIVPTTEAIALPETPTQQPPIGQSPQA